MRLIDIDQQIFVPIVDDVQGTSYEVQMTIAELFDRFLEGFQPQVVDAIPVEWLREMMINADDNADTELANAISWLIQTWQKGQEAQQ